MGGLVLYPLLNVDVYLSKCLTNIDLRVIQNIIEDPSIILAWQKYDDQALGAKSNCSG